MPPVTPLATPLVIAILGEVGPSTRQEMMVLKTVCSSKDCAPAAAASEDRSSVV